MPITELSKIIKDTKRVIYSDKIEHKYLSDTLGRKQGQASALVFPTSTEEAHNLGGLISGEHGLGVSKRNFFFKESAPENVQLMNQIKLAFDPKKILNSNISYVK